MKNILIVGGEGYIGNIVSYRLLNKGYTIYSYDNLLYQNHQCVLAKTIYKNYNFINGDMLDTMTIEPLINSVDAVILLAGLVGDPITKKFPKESKIINDDGVENVINICANSNVEKLIFISTCSNYGLIKDDQIANEEFELNPLSLYAKSKVNAEKKILSLKGKTNLQPTILRFATAFGLSPRMRFDLTVSEFCYDLALGKELVVYDSETWRPYCHVNDFAKLIEIVLDAPKEKVSFEVFNAGGDINNATKQMIVDLILKHVPEGKVKFQDQGNDPRNYRVNFSKVKNILGFEPKFSVEYGIAELLEAIKNNLFNKIHENRNFHGNYDIEYKING